MKKIQILGTGCAKCEKLAASTKEVADNLGLQYEMEKVTDLNQIMGYGVMTTPGLVIDGKVMAAGKIPGAAELENMLK
jgi:small redox-active disulfide protein 2